MADTDHFEDYDPSEYNDPDQYEDAECWQCGGDGYGIVGEDWSGDPLWDDMGACERCPCCRGSGLAKNCTYW